MVIWAGSVAPVLRYAGGSPRLSDSPGLDLFGGGVPGGGPEGGGGACEGERGPVGCRATASVAGLVSFDYFRPVLLVANQIITAENVSS